MEFNEALLETDFSNLENIIESGAQNIDWGMVAGIFTAILGAFAILFIIMIALMVLMTIANWFVFKKIGKKGWESLIPFHSTFVLYESVGLCPAWLLLILYGGIIPIIGGIAVFIAAIALAIIYKIKLSKAFGHGAGFAVGLILLPVVFYPILAFGSSKYVGIEKAQETKIEEVL